MTDYNDKPPDVNDGAPETSRASNETGQDIDWLTRAREAFRSSTSYVDSNYRKKWDDSIKAFHNEHASDSKYNTASFEKRSRIYRPKTRATIRKNEAAAATAFFSTVDTVTISAENDGDPKARVNADIYKAWLEYRLQADPDKNGIPWFQIVIGGLQDAQTQGGVVARVEWKYQEGKEDRPWVELLPVENIRIDPGAHWYDPVRTSPYFIELRPMYVCDIHVKMQSGEWKQYDDAVIRQAMQNTPDQTRQARNPGQQDVYENNTPIGDYEKVWVQRHIHRSYGRDYHFYTLGTERLLTDPVPLEEVEFHGRRPYVMGVASMETHRVFPDSVPQLIDGLQKETNEVANQRLDNVKFVLNKRYFVRRGRNVDVASLIRNVPGGVTMMDDVEADIKESQWPDVTGSSFQEQDRINADIDDLVGNFSGGSVQTNRKLNETVGGMNLMAQAAGGLTTYMLMTYTETFVERVLRLLILLGAKYETDQRVLAIAGDKAQLRAKYGMDIKVDQLLDEELLVKANVAMGASDPAQKLQRFGFAAKMLSDIGLTAQQTGMNMTEVSKEIFAHAGYRNGERFMISSDPQKMQMQQQIQQLTGVLQQMEAKLKSKDGDGQAKVAQTQIQAQAGLQETALKEQSAMRQIVVKEQGAMAREQVKQQGENRRALVTAKVNMDKNEQQAKQKSRAES
jgi:hypothetical protein